VPSVRFSRDKRGYEYVYLVHAPTRRGKPGRSRVIYWYRTPPGVRVGRKPFDEEVQRTLEQQYPGVAFDWTAIINTPMPPPDMTEYWRERRRAEKLARQERREMEAEEASAPDVPLEETLALPIELSEPVALLPESEILTADSTATTGENGTDVEAADASTQQKKRRRRRGGRKRRLVAPEATAMAGTEGLPERADQAGGADPADALDADIGSSDQSETADSTSEEE
jgi:hypothetical protein